MNTRLTFVNPQFPGARTKTDDPKRLVPPVRTVERELHGPHARDDPAHMEGAARDFVSVDNLIRVVGVRGPAALQRHQEPDVRSVAVRRAARVVQAHVLLVQA